MTNDVILRPEAEADLAAALGWYEQQRRGLGDEFLLCIEETLDRVSSNPLAYTEVEPGVRRALVRRFPYAVFYLAASSPIVVIAVFHCFGDPDSLTPRRAIKR